MFASNSKIRAGIVGTFSTTIGNSQSGNASNPPTASAPDASIPDNVYEYCYRFTLTKR